MSTLLLAFLITWPGQDVKPTFFDTSMIKQQMEYKTIIISPEYRYIGSDFRGHHFTREDAPVYTPPEKCWCDFHYKSYITLEHPVLRNPVFLDRK